MKRGLLLVLVLTIFVSGCFEEETQEKEKTNDKLYICDDAKLVSSLQECVPTACTTDEQCSNIDCSPLEPKKATQGQCWNFTPGCKSGYCRCNPSICA